MDGYSNLAVSSPPAVTAAASGGGRARPSLELTNTKETKAWEGLAIGAVTLAQTFSTGSHRFRRTGSERRRRSRSGLAGALRRAFSMRRHPAGPGAGDGYWRIHDMDGDSSDCGDGDTVDEHGEDEAAAAEVVVESKNKKEEEQRNEVGAAANAAAAVKEDEAEGRKATKTKKRGVGILKACKKLFRL